jgi:hypothetical protein
MLERSHDGNDKDLGGGCQPPPPRTPSDVKLVLVSRMIKDKRDQGGWKGLAIYKLSK